MANTNIPPRGASAVNYSVNIMPARGYDVGETPNDQDIVDENRRLLQIQNAQKAGANLPVDFLAKAIIRHHQVVGLLVGENLTNQLQAIQLQPGQLEAQMGQLEAHVNQRFNVTEELEARVNQRFNVFKERLDAFEARMNADRQG